VKNPRCFLKNFQNFLQVVMLQPFTEEKIRYAGENAKTSMFMVSSSSKAAVISCEPDTNGFQ